MTEDKAGTAAELEKELREFVDDRTNNSVEAAYMEKIADALAALRKQLAEARRERDELNRSIFGLYDTCAKYRADNAKKDAALREAISLLTRERDLLDRERPNMTKSKDWRYDPPATEAELQYWEGYRRGVDLAIRTLTASQEAPASPAAGDFVPEYGFITAPIPTTASPSPGLNDRIKQRLREAVIEECAQAVEKRAYEIGRQECCGFGQGSPPECCGDPNLVILNRDAADAIRALSRPVSERGQP